MATLDKFPGLTKQVDELYGKEAPREQPYKYKYEARELVVC